MRALCTIGADSDMRRNPREIVGRGRSQSKRARLTQTRNFEFVFQFTGLSSGARRVRVLNSVGTTEMRIGARQIETPDGPHADWPERANHDWLNRRGARLAMATTSSTGSIGLTRCI